MLSLALLLVLMFFFFCFCFCFCHTLHCSHLGRGRGKKGKGLDYVVFVHGAFVLLALLFVFFFSSRCRGLLVAACDCGSSWPFLCV